MGLDIGIRKLKIIKDEEMYWRKANQIHNWFDNKFGYEDSKFMGCNLDK